MRPRGWFARKGKRWESQCRECRKPAKAAAAATRRTRLLGRGTYTAADVRLLYRSQGGECALCRRTLVGGYHVDHIIPIAKGGMNVVGNLQLLCQRCNLTKGAKL
jgi:5-methylcytosine-specific restriction endonuclease McrA